MSTELSSSMHNHYVFYKRTKNTSKAGSAATSAQVYLSTIVFTYVFLYIYDLPLNFSRKHCVNTYTHTHTSNSFHVDHKIV